MKRILLLTIFLMSGNWLFAQSYPDTIEITTADLPYTLPSNNTLYLLGGTIHGDASTASSATNGIICNGRTNVKISGRYIITTIALKRKLAFTVGGGDAKYGIMVSNSDSVIIEDMVIMAGGTSGLDDDNDSGNVCIRETGQTHKVHVRNCVLVTDGLDGKCFHNTVDSHYDTYNWNFVGCDFSTNSNKFTRRDYYMGSLIVMEFSAQVEAPDYSLLIDSCNFSRAIYTPVAVIGSSVPSDSGALVIVRHSTFHLQGRNDLYTTFTDDATHSLGDNFAMSFIGLRRGSKIYSNTVYSDDIALHYGGSGILIQGAHGWPLEPVEFYNNWMILRNGRHIVLSALKQAAIGFYIRALDLINANQNLWVYNNNIQIYVDSSQATTSTGRTAEGIRVLMDDLSSDIIIANNRISTNRSDSAAGMGNGTGDSEIITSAITIAQQPEVPMGELSIYNNYFGDWKNPVRFGSNRESSLGANNIALIRDTLVAYTDRDTTFWFETNGSYIYHSINNIHQDCVFLGYANPYDIVFAGGSAVDTLGKSVEHWQTVKLLCLGSDGEPIASATVRYGNAYHERPFGVSNYLGWAEGVVLVRYDHQDYITGDAYNPGDSLFNPFLFTAYTDGMTDTATVTMTVSTTVFTDTLVFDNTPGVIPAGAARVLIRKSNPASESQILLPPFRD